MTGAASDKGADIALDAVFGRATQTARTVYLALYTSDPGRTATPATAGEYSATGYARVAYTPNTPATSGSGRLTNNTNAITFGPITGATGSVSITHVCAVSSSSGTTGDLLWRWAVDTARSPAAGDSISVAIGAVTASITVTPLA